MVRPYIAAGAALYPRARALPRLQRGQHASRETQLSQRVKREKGRAGIDGLKHEADFALVLRVNTAASIRVTRVGVQHVDCVSNSGARQRAVAQTSPFISETEPLALEFEDCGIARLR